MNSLVSSLRLAARCVPQRALAARVIAPRMGMIVRGYATRKGQTIDSVVTEKQRKNEFIRMLEEETSVLRQSLEDAEANNVSTEVTDRFLKETGFKLEEDRDEGIIKLTKTLSDKTIEVIFADSPEDYEPSREYDEEEGEEGEEGEAEAEAEEKGEEGEEGEEGEAQGEEREHSFTVELKSTKPGKEGQSFLFQCFAKNDGSFVVNKLTSGDHIPVQISYWNEDLQRELIQFLDPLGINERLSYFIHQYLNKKETEENIQVLEEFRDFVSGR